MSVPGLLVALVLLSAIIIMVVPPLFERDKPSPEDEASADQSQPGIEARRERLLAYYNRVLTNIRDLDEDLATGKINPADHETERELWMQRGIQALKELDSTASQQTADDPIEKAVAAYREKTRNAPAK